MPVDRSPARSFNPDAREAMIGIRGVMDRRKRDSEVPRLNRACRYRKRKSRPAGSAFFASNRGRLPPRTQPSNLQPISDKAEAKRVQVDNLCSTAQPNASTGKEIWWAPRESNPAPTNYEFAALTKHELGAPM
ncbi:hypothetical protein BVI434_360055 [Burkholderia vietnamiensis]|nr:hypothetical protein BVI434_360055 [Burkholderia vietnamiensis]